MARIAAQVLAGGLPIHGVTTASDGYGGSGFAALCAASRRAEV